MAQKKVVINRKHSKVIVTLLCIGISASLIGCSDEEAKAVVEKLDRATEVQHDGDRYLFDYSNQWEINYNEDAQTVALNESAVADCVAAFSGLDSIGENAGKVIYDWNKNTYHTYVDFEDQEGNTVSIVKYSIDDKEWSIMSDTGNGSEWYEASDDFIDCANEYGLVDIMNDDLKNFENTLNDNDLSLDDLKKISYKDIDNYYSHN